MSLSFRERMQRAKRKILERLDLTEEDWEFIWDNISSFCSKSDEQLKFVEGDACNVDAEIDAMYDDEFMEHVCDIIEEIFEKLGYIKKKQRGKKKKKKESESEDEEEVDEETEQENAEQYEEQEVEVENK